jgi:hypothetical protein
VARRFVKAQVDRFDRRQVVVLERDVAEQVGRRETETVQMTGLSRRSRDGMMFQNAFHIETL